MKYFNLTAINLAIERLSRENIPYEHRVGTFSGTVLPVYFKPDKYTITPEQI